MVMEISAKESQLLIAKMTSEEIAALFNENHILKAKNEQLLLENKALAAVNGKQEIINTLSVEQVKTIQTFQILHWLFRL